MFCYWTPEYVLYIQVFIVKFGFFVILNYSKKINLWSFASKILIFSINIKILYAIHNCKPSYITHLQMYVLKVSNSMSGPFIAFKCNRAFKLIKIMNCKICKWREEENIWIKFILSQFMLSTTRFLNCKTTSTSSSEILKWKRKQRMNFNRRMKEVYK